MTARDDAIAAADALADVDVEQQEAMRRRDDAIRAWYAEGATMREIAEAVGLTHSAVNFILKKPVQSP